MKIFEFVAPFEVTGAVHGERGARDQPAAEVLRTGGEQQRFGGIRRKAGDPIVEPLSVEEFAGIWFVSDFNIRIFRVFFIETFERAREAARICDWTDDW